MIFSFSDLHKAIQSNLHLIPRNVDLIVAIPRSGLLPGMHVATSLNLPLITLGELQGQDFLEQRFTARKYLSLRSYPKNVLVIDDSSNTGSRINQAREIISKKWPSAKVSSFTVFKAKNSSFSPDYWIISSDTPRVFAWNMFNHNQLTGEIAIDLDGILCPDPTSQENDDGDKYLNFIQNTTLKVSPLFAVKAIVTGRLEKYRKPTEKWLQKNGVQYGELVMNDAPDALFRRTKKFVTDFGEVDQISDFKSQALIRIKPLLFVESNLNQAMNITKLTSITTYAFDDDLVIHPNA